MLLVTPASSSSSWQYCCIHAHWNEQDQRTGRTEVHPILPPQQRGAVSGCGWSAKIKSGQPNDRGNTMPGLYSGLVSLWWAKPSERCLVSRWPKYSWNWGTENYVCLCGGRMQCKLWNATPIRLDGDLRNFRAPATNLHSELRSS